MPARIAVDHHSSTGHVHQLAETLAEGAEASGAEVRRREVATSFTSSQNRHGGQGSMILAPNDVLHQGRRLAEDAERLVATREPAAA